MLAHAELLAHQYCKILLPRAVLDLFPTQPVFTSGIVLVQDLAFECGLQRSTFQVVKVPLDAILSLQCVVSTTQLGAVRNIAESGVDSVVHIADKDDK